MESDLYFVALSSALTLSNVCGKVTYPNESSSRKGYIYWYDEEIGKYEKNPEDKENMPYLPGEVIYSLRCSLLHEGNTNMNNNSLRTDLPPVDIEKVFSELVKGSEEFI